MQNAHKSRKLPKSVRPEEFITLIKCIPVKDKISKIAFLLAYGSGMRVSEVKACRSEHFQDKLISIDDSKYGRDRKVPIPKGWRKEFLRELPLNRSISSLERRFNKYRNSAKLNPKYTFHSLRHGFATRSIESGIPLNQLMLLLGHTDMSTTSIYTKALPIDALKSYEDLF